MPVRSIQVTAPDAHAFTISPAPTPTPSSRRQRPRRKRRPGSRPGTPHQYRPGLYFDVRQQCAGPAAPLHPAARISTTSAAARTYYPVDAKPYTSARLSYRGVPEPLDGSAFNSYYGEGNW